MEMIRLQHISKSFKTIKAVDNVSFSIPAAKITILTGADGAGKSTVFKLIIGLVKKDHGHIYLKGKNIHQQYQSVTSICGYMPEGFSLYPDLTVEENMNFFADIHQVSLQRRENLKNSLLEKTGMIQFKKRKAGALSGGMKQKLALSTILLSAPELIILDEPTTGVDPLSRIEFLEIINQLKQEGKTIILSTPYLDEAEKGDHVVFLNEGRVLKENSLTSLKNQFPAKLFRIIPKGNIYEIVDQLQKKSLLKGNIYIKGRYIKYLQIYPEENFHKIIPHQVIEEESAGLEDIYLFYESQAEIKSEKDYE